MPKTMIYTGTLVIEECCDCHVAFAMPADLQRRCREAGPKIKFWCPLGHVQYYVRSEVQKLADQLARADAARRAALDQADAAERSARAYRGHATRLRNRAAAGICPVDGCHRHFANLGRHMAGQHPDFGGDHA